MISEKELEGLKGSLDEDLRYEVVAKRNHAVAMGAEFAIEVENVVRLYNDRRNAVASVDCARSELERLITEDVIAKYDNYVAKKKEFDDEVNRVSCEILAADNWVNSKGLIWANALGDDRKKKYLTRKLDPFEDGCCVLLKAVNYGFGDYVCEEVETPEDFPVVNDEDKKFKERLDAARSEISEMIPPILEAFKRLSEAFDYLNMVETGVKDALPICCDRAPWLRRLMEDVDKALDLARLSQAERLRDEEEEVQRLRASAAEIESKLSRHSKVDS